MTRIAFLSLLLLLNSAVAQQSSSEVYHQFLKLKSLKRVLYLAAHPDDENTRALAYFSNHENASTAYLSLTRGDGGQNLIGDELGDELGVLRTQELLAARAHDGSQQFFTRAVDFGYSKSADESIEKWGNDLILSDVVYVIRKFKPDVIITRFPPDKRGGHGHHTASAMLAIEAYAKASDKDYMPDQVIKFGTHQVHAVYWNSSIWWDDKIAEKANNNSKYLVKDIGGFNSLLGKSYNEIGTIARSQHKCQGFGAIVERGQRVEYFEHLAGAQFEEDFFELNTVSDWETYIGKEGQQFMEELRANFDFKDLANNLSILLKIKKKLAEIDDFHQHFKIEKIELIDQLIADCMGLYTECSSSDYVFATGSEIDVEVKMLNRSSEEVYFLNGNGKTILPTNDWLIVNEKKTIPASVSNPYWLKKEHNDVFELENMDDLGKARTPFTSPFTLSFIYQSDTFHITQPLEYVWRDPAYGERRREVIATPSITVNLEENLSILKPGDKQLVRAKIHAYQDSLKTTLSLNVPKGWKVSNSSFELNFQKKHDEQWIEFELTCSAQSERGNLVFTNENGDIVHQLKEIAYDHIPTQVVIKPSRLVCIPLDVEIAHGKIAYIKGVKDKVAQSLRLMGFTVEEFEVSDLARLDLTEFQSVVLGIRIYNVHPELLNYQAKLTDYMKQGGNVVTQYNTASRNVRTKNLGPYPFQLTRKRVTEEDAEVQFLNDKHRLLNWPNKINTNDFDDWVQERGLYFAGEWSDEYEALFSWHDKGEKAQKGALIVAQVGQGQFIYTGISFFRELPNGVVGAYKLFANLVSYKK